jgi:hypothetical protein
LIIVLNVKIVIVLKIVTDSFYCEGEIMSSEFNGLTDAILGQLSQIGIEIFNDKKDDDIDDLVPKAIYEISKKSTINNTKDSNKIKK